MTISPKEAVKIAQDHACYLKFNAMLIDIFENNLTPYILDALKCQLSEQSFLDAKARLSSINILPKVIDKLTNIYQTTVTRNALGGKDSDKAGLAYYEDVMKPNDQLDSSNEMYNLCQASLIYPCVDEGKPCLKIIENDRFIPVAAKPMHPTTLTDVILLGGKDENNVDLFWVWSDDEFYICDAQEQYRPDKLLQLMPDATGANPVGALPFVYVNSSKRRIVPKQDIDGIELVKLIPIMLTDLNMAAMYQSFSIVYGIDVDDENLVRAPNSFWRFKTKPGQTDAKPSIGTIKPEVDFQQVLELITSQLSLWLGTKGIRASTVGGLDKDNFASGISKVIDEMDTFEARQKQVTKYQTAEQQLWDLITTKMHPYWLQSKQLTDPEAQFSWTPGIKISTKFTVQMPTQTRGQLVNDLKTEVDASFTTRKKAIENLNPELSEEQVDELMEQIAEEHKGGENNGGDPAKDNNQSPNVENQGGEAEAS